MGTGVFLGYVAQSTKKINPFLKVVLSFLCEFHFVDLKGAVYVCVSVRVVTFAWMHVLRKSFRVEEMFELMLHLQSYLQIKAKNYDKVEKVSVHYTHENWLVCHSDTWEGSFDCFELVYLFIIIFVVYTRICMDSIIVPI